MNLVLIFKTTYKPVKSQKRDSTNAMSNASHFMYLPISSSHINDQLYTAIRQPQLFTLHALRRLECRHISVSNAPGGVG